MSYKVSILSALILLSAVNLFSQQNKVFISRIVNKTNKNLIMRRVTNIDQSVTMDPNQPVVEKIYEPFLKIPKQSTISKKIRMPLTPLAQTVQVGLAVYNVENAMFEIVDPLDNSYIFNLRITRNLSDLVDDVINGVNVQYRSLILDIDAQLERQDLGFDQQIDTERLEYNLFPDDVDTTTIQLVLEDGPDGKLENSLATAGTSISRTFQLPNQPIE